MDSFTIPNVGTITAQEYYWAISGIFEYSEIEKIRKQHLQLWGKYLIEYKGKPLSLNWQVRKGNNTFWLGMETPHTFFDKYDIKFLPKKQKVEGKTVYQIDFYEIEVFDDEVFQYASNNKDRKLLYNKDTNYNTFRDFSLGLNVIATKQLFGSNK